MPIFEFRCLECGHLFEKLFVGANDQPELACPKCQRESLERVVSRTSYMMGAGPGGNKPTVTEKSCAPGSRCMTLDIPGPSK